MQVQQLPIYQFLEGQRKSFVIPVYQRDYAWTRINCQKLWDDLVDLNNNDRNDHFLGAVVTIGSGFDEYTVIDGQQRITTISVLLIALQTYLKNKEHKNDSEKILIEQLSDFLINRYSNQEKKIRLKPNKQDKEYFENLFTDNRNLNINSNIVNNYNFFYKKIISETLTPQQIFEAFRKLKIVLIDLVRVQDDPQLIFESLNSTGVDLTAGDLIRNYILMDLEPPEQEKLYKSYWIEIEKLTGDIAEFVRNYLIFKLNIWVKRDDVYAIFKKFSTEKFYKNKEGILKDLLFFSKIYSWLVQTQNHPSSSINNELSKLNKLEFTVCHPFLLDVFNELTLGNLDGDTIKNILIIIESYAFRKILVDNTTQGLNKLFISLARDIKKEESWKKQYINILSYILLEKRISQRFPNNEEFENALINKETYKLQSKNKNFLLESLESYKSAYQVNFDDLTVEHIMPQTLTKDWKHKLGENWQEIHNKYLHTLGNLSLTAKNTELSNNSFEDKQKIDFQISKLKLNFKLEGLTLWNEEKIVERAKDLIKNAKNIWPYPQTTYTKPIPEEQLFDLTSEDSFSGSKPSHLYFEDDQKGIELKTWRDLLINTCNYLFEFSPTQFKEIQNNPEFKWYFDLKKPMRHKLEFRPNEFIEGSSSANGIISFLAKMCDRLNYQPENIQFSINVVND
ncbi:DUF262 domain-containing protein [Candidatus Peregrinibacteria bacterium]|nr:DUF262 domain-containing protein [Candidatus Peregrinibacteria bacterium]